MPKVDVKYNGFADIVWEVRVDGKPVHSFSYESDARLYAEELQERLALEDNYLSNLCPNCNLPLENDVCTYCGWHREKPYFVGANMKKLSQEDMQSLKEEAIRENLIAENDAVMSYDKYIQLMPEGDEIRLGLEEIRDEEKKHIGELQALLAKLNPEEQELFNEGESEVNEIKQAFEAGFEAGLKYNKAGMSIEAMPWYKQVPSINDSSEWVVVSDGWHGNSYVWDCGQERCFVIWDGEEDGLGWMWIELPYNAKFVIEELENPEMRDLDMQYNNNVYEDGFSSKEEAQRALADWWSSDKNHRHTAK